MNSLIEKRVWTDDEYLHSVPKELEAATIPNWVWDWTIPLHLRASN